MTNEEYMRFCFRLAEKGIADVAPNPMVGAIVVHQDEIIGQGYHEKYGCPHAEPNAINSVKNQELLKESTLYVNLEPCSHYGKTPPCVDLIIEKKIPQVVISNVDPNPQVAGRGIKKLEQAGVKVISGVLADEGWELNKRFFTFQIKKRPYIFLKWAQSSDDFMDKIRENLSDSPVTFSTPETQQLNHKIRAEEAAILVGTNTVLLDNPQLTTRLWQGKNPLRITFDCDNRIPAGARILDESAPTLIFSNKTEKVNNFVTFVAIDFSKDILPQVMNELYARQITSLIVEGGAQTLRSFIENNLWDEAKVEIAPFSLKNGIAAPKLTENLLYNEELIGENKLRYFKNVSVD
jgi:diaminohydroxyphosphoribosylaminopyrimidine deaminase/5-amino-6-(5-phosphoribosylamino)uracil reductase